MKATGVAVVVALLLLAVSSTASASGEDNSSTISRTSTVGWSTTDSTGQPASVEQRLRCRKYGAKVRLRVIATRNVFDVQPLSRLNIKVGLKGKTVRRSVRPEQREGMIVYSFQLRPGAYIKRANALVFFNSKNDWSQPGLGRREVCRRP